MCVVLAVKPFDVVVRSRQLVFFAEILVLFTMNCDGNIAI